MQFGGRNVSRRNFVKSVSAVVGTTALAPYNKTLASESTAADRTGKYLDFHVHLAQQWVGKDQGPLTARQLIHWMDANDIAKAVVLPLVSPESFWYPVTTEYVLSETQPFRDRLIPFCAVDPRTLATHLTDKQQLVDMLRRYYEAGARGFGEHKPMLPIDDPLNMKLYEACCEVKLPVLFHLDNYANMDQPGLPGLAKVLSALPDLIMIGHGKGWWASIAGGLSQEDLQIGYPRGPVSPGGALDQLMDQHSNLYADLSSSGAHAILRDRTFGAAFLRRRADRLLFGTDYYSLKQLDFPHFNLLEQFELPLEEAKKIAKGNAIRILQLA